MEGEEVVDDDDEATRDDWEFCLECSPHDLLYPDIPEFMDRFWAFRDGRRGVMGRGSMYDGNILPISTSLELNEPACLRILDLSLSTPGDCAEYERNIGRGGGMNEGGGRELEEVNGMCGLT